MAMIPLNQQITVTKSNGVDKWGKPLPGTPVLYDCRIDEGTNKVVDTNGNEVLSYATVYIEGLVEVNYTDKISFTNELNISTNDFPIKVNILRSFSGEPLFTVVYI